MGEAMIPSYPQIYGLGHKAIADLFLDPVVVQEKVDGSQISFGLVPMNECQSPAECQDPCQTDHFALRIRSKGAELNLAAPDKMFSPGVAIIQGLVSHLEPGWVYRGEYLAKTKHNVLAYDRMPHCHIILFDITTGPECYLSPQEVAIEATRLGLEVTPTMYTGMITEPAFLRELLQTTSCLGGPTVEGLVIKNYHRWGRDKHCLMGKFVSEQFKEVHAGEWKKANPGGADILALLVAKYRTPARWMKAVQHRRDAGLLVDAPQDIGPLIPEIGADVEKECKEEIMEFLYSWAWPKVRRGLSAGFALWYKERLLERQFERELQDDGVAADLARAHAQFLEGRDEALAEVDTDRGNPG